MAKPVAGEAAAALPINFALLHFALTLFNDHSKLGSTNDQPPWFFGSSWHHINSASLNLVNSFIKDKAGNG